MLKDVRTSEGELADYNLTFDKLRSKTRPEDIRNIGADVLRHRIILSYEADAEELTSEDVIQSLFEVVEVP